MGFAVRPAAWLLGACLLSASLAGVCAQSGRQIGVLGPANTMFKAQARTAAAPLARGGGSCRVYGDVSSYFGGASPTSFSLAATEIRPPGAGASLGSAAVIATASGSGLSGSTALATGALPANATPIQRTMSGFAYVATTTTCSSNSLLLTLQSVPAGSGQTVIATLSGQQMPLSYLAQFVSQGRYFCYNAGNPYRTFVCNVWRVDVGFSIVPNAIPGSGAGTYQVNIFQADVSAR